MYNPFHNIVRVFNVSPNFRLFASEKKRDYQLLITCYSVHDNYFSDLFTEVEI